MNPSIVAFLVTLLFASLPAGFVCVTIVQGHWPGFVLGTAVVAAVTTGSVVRSRGARAWVRVLVGLLTCAAMPFVAGGVTGLGVGLSGGPFAGVAESVFVGFTGAYLLYVPLLGAALVAWALAFGAHRLAGRWAARR
jgi:hypothetical protein